MATNASLTVRISADINSLVADFDKMTRTVDRAANKIASVGEAMTIGITLPVVAAAAALAKLAADNEDTAGRFERVLGGAAVSVDASIQKMMASVPQGKTELQKMAIAVDNMAQGLGLAPAKAAQMSESLLKLAGDASAFAHVPMEEALNALERGLAGKTKGLLQFGIAINETDIKQKAMSMNLLHEGNTLTETGTALASYALIMERATRITGEAERTAGQAGKSFEFLKRDVGELADNVSHLVLPALSDLANKAREIVGWFAKLDDSTVKTFFDIAAGAAIIGPVIVAFAGLVKGAFAVSSAITLLKAGGGIAAIFEGITAASFATIAAGVAATVAGLAVLVAAIVAVVAAWKKFGPAGKSAIEMQTVPSLATPFKLEHVAPSEAQLKDFPHLAGPANGATEFKPQVDAMKDLEEKSHAVTDALKQMGEGWEIPNLTKVWFDTLGLVQQKLSTIKDLMSPDAGKLRSMIDDLKNSAATAFAPKNLPDANAIARLGVQTTKPGVTINPQVATLPDFSLANKAAADFAKSQDSVTESVAYDYQALRAGLEQFGIHIGNVTQKMQGLAVGVSNALQYLANYEVQRLTGSGKNAGLFGALGGMLGPGVLTLLGDFASLTPLGLAVGTIGGTVIGGLVGSLFDHASASTDNAASSMDDLAKQVDKVTESITNVPQWFKIQVERFAASPVVTLTPPPPIHTPGGGVFNPGAATGTTGGGGGGSASVTINEVHVHVANAAEAGDMETLTTKLYAYALKQRGTGSRAPLVFARTGAI